MAYEESAKEGEVAALIQSLTGLEAGSKLLFIFGPEGGLSPAEIESFTAVSYTHLEQERSNMELGIKNRYRMIFQHFGYIHSVPDIASVNKALSVLLNELDIYPIITTKGARHTYGSYLWHKGFDLGVIAKILGHRDISMLVEVYGHTLEEKIFEEFNQIRDIWRDCS